MKMISWNVNGLRACVQKGFLEQFDRLNADFFCLQETKMQEGQLQLELPGYVQYWNSAEKKGYSGTSIFTKHIPLSVRYGLGIPELDTEGRLITLEYPEFYLVNCYTPNAQRGLARIDHRLRWDAAFREYIARLDGEKPVVICGDLNVAHKEIDLKNPGPNRGNAGFSDEERSSFTETLELGFTDTFRYLHPDTVGAYTWWSYMFNARQNNAGWRIDYFLVSRRLQDAVYKTPIYSDILGSDHCPVGLELDIPCNGSIWSGQQGQSSANANKQIGKTRKAALKNAVKLGALALVTAGLLLGVARFLPAESLETDGTEQPTQTVPDPGDKQELITAIPCSAGMKAAPISSSLYLVGNGTESWNMEPYSPSLGQAIVKRPNCWVRLELTEYGKSAKNKNLLTKNPTVTFGKDSVWGSNLAEAGDGVSWGVSKYFDDDGNVDGWFFYGYLPRNTLLHVQLEDQVYTMAAEPEITQADAVSMSTSQLVDYVAHYTFWNSSSLYGDSGAKLKQDYQNKAENTPALQRLAERKDAGEKVMIFVSQNPDSFGGDLLRQIFPWETDKEATNFSLSEAQDTEVDLLVWYALRSRELQKCITEKTKEERNSVWQTLCSEYPLFSMLNDHKLSCEELLKYCRTCNGSILQQTAGDLIPLLSRRMPQSQSEQYEKYKESAGKYKLESVSQSEAENMTTEELVSRVAESHLDPDMIYFVDLFLSPSSYILSSSSSTVTAPSLSLSSAGSDTSLVSLYTGEMDYYKSFYDAYAVVRELESRQDAVSSLLEYCDNAQYGSVEYERAQFLLRQISYLEKMTQTEAQAYISSQFGDVMLSAVSTTKLAKIAVRQIMPIAMKWTQSSADNPQARYQQICKEFPVLLELEKRGNDAVSCLMSCGDAQKADRAYLQPYVAFLFSQEPYRKLIASSVFDGQYRSLIAETVTAAEAKKMTTEQLVEHAVNLTQLKRTGVSYTVFYMAFFKSCYEGSVKIYPVLAELETREDAVAALMNHARTGDEIKSGMERKIATWILQMDVYRKKMTVEEAESALDLMETYVWGQKILELTTVSLARVCLSEYFLHTQLLEAQTPEEAEKIYMEIFRKYVPLTVLEAREDVIEELLFFCDSSNLSVTELQKKNALSLLCLDRYYSKMTNEQKLTLAQLLVSG